ncbi:hypothetical protein NX794_23520 [Streptomyces sp. LP11]|uniref:Cellulase n=1 Tax=Streptomyces pyxinicus TaxID=2970331 RepID=A0ABT2B6P2_9ACTN|nr:hypothetical protein [Streptomyces sp. LP11]MCS0604161.1 hypothetical protein [Streptomyces sp. LP11]
MEHGVRGDGGDRVFADGPPTRSGASDRPDVFESRLAELMHASREPARFGPRHREALRAGVRARRRARAARRAAGSVLAVAGLGLGLFLWPHGQTDDRPSAPGPRPAVSPAPDPSGPPSSTPTGPPTAPETTSTVLPDAPTVTTSDPPTGTASSTAGDDGPSPTATASETWTAPPPTDTADPSDTPSSVISATG